MVVGSKKKYCSGALNECVFTSMMPCRSLEMGVVRERGASLNGSGVEFSLRKVEIRYGMCRKVLQSGAALKAIVKRGSVISNRRCTVLRLSRSVHIFFHSSLPFKLKKAQMCKGLPANFKDCSAGLYSKGSCCWRCFALTSLAILGHFPVSPDQQEQA